MRGRRHNRVLVVALTVSALLHLSAVTVFRVVIYFPREDIEYVQFSIVRAAPEPAIESGAGPGGAWRPPHLAAGLDHGRLAMRAPLPDVELPTLEFAELQRLRVRQEGMLSDEMRREIFHEEEGDSWRRFGQHLDRVRRSLTGLSLSGGAEGYPETSLAVPAAGLEPELPAARPADGYEAFLEWNTEPADRQLLFAPPIQALWDASPATLRLPLAIVIEVSAMGRVVNVWSPAVDEDGLVDAVQLGVLKYKFEPLDDAAAPNQLGTLRIDKARAGP